MSEKRGAKSLFTQLTRPLAAIGRRLAAQDQVEAPPPSDPNAEPFDDRIVDDAFTLTLETMLAEDAGRFQVKLQIISLVQFREAVGDKWTRLSEKVMLIAEGVIQQHLGPGNVSGRQGQDFFVLLFRAVSRDEGRRRAHLIAKELGARLLGDQFIAGDEPLALAAEIDLGDAVWPDGRLRIEALDEVISATREEIAQAAPGRDPRPDPVLKTMVATEGQARLVQRPIAKATRGGPADDSGANAAAEVHGLSTTTWDAQDTFNAGEAIDPRWRAFKSGQTRPKAEPNWQPLQAPPRRPAREPDWRPLDAGPADRPAVPDLPGDAALGLVWRPTWLASGEMIGAFAARISRTDAPGQPAREGTLAYPAGGDGPVLLDRFAMAGLVREIGATVATPPPALLILPLHWETVHSPRRIALLAPLAALPGEVRAARLLIDLFGVPDDVTSRDMLATVLALRPLCRDVLLRVSLDTPRSARAAECGVSTIGVDLAELAPSRLDDEEGLSRSLAGLRQAAAAAGLRAYAWGLRRRAALIATVGGGFALVNGPALIRDLPAPGRCLPAPRQRFTAG